MTRIKIEKTDKEKKQKQETEPGTAEELVSHNQLSGNSDSNQSELKQKLEDLEKQYLYLRADFANYKRNMEQERNQFQEQGKDEVLKDLFMLFEHLERALAWAREQNNPKAILEGLELTQKEFSKILEKYKVERIPTVGEKFNPEFHEAISVVEDEDQEPGTIIYEQQPGFMRNGKLLQPARVVVVKEPENKKHKVIN